MGGLATYQSVGWVFYNIRFVDIFYTDVDVFSPAGSFIDSENVFTVLLYFIPSALLVIAGLTVGRYHDAADPTQGAIAGALLTPGYLVLSIGGTFLFTVSVGHASGAPNLIPAVHVAGLVYPTASGALGGVLASVTADQ